MPKSKTEDILPKNHAEPQRKTAVTLGDTVYTMLNKPAGEGNRLKVNFDDVSVGYGSLQARVDGAITLNVELENK